MRSIRTARQLADLQRREYALRTQISAALQAGRKPNRHARRAHEKMFRTLAGRAYK